MPEKLTLSDGAEVSLGRLISSGGEGAVYEIDGVSGIALKVYHEDRRTADRGRKLEAMLTAPPDNIQTRDHLAIAWPIEAVIDEEGRVAGFTMPLARDAQVLSELLNPRSRAEIAPDMTWQHMVNVAQNVSAVVDSLHSAGYVVGDLSERNFLVTRDALVTLIDCDSVQVPADDGTMFFSPVGTARFTAPELLGMDFESQPRTVEGDRFALAVLIFLILSEGYHPFQGVPADDKFSGDDVSAIRLGAYAYADRAGVLSPPPAAPNVESLPPVLAQLFERTFVRGHRDTSQRVAAGTWRSTLELIGRSLRTCSREPRHVFWSLDQQCPWCERAARIGADTWCLAPVEDHATSVAAPGLPPSASPPPAAAARQPRPSSRDQFVGALTIAVAGLFAWLLAFGLLSAGRGESPGGDPRVSQPTAIPSPNVTELAGAPPTATPSTGATGRTTVPTTGGSLGSRWIANTGGTGVKARTDCEAGASTSGDALVEGQSVTLDQIGSGRCSGWSRVVTGGSFIRRIWVSDIYLSSAAPGDSSVQRLPQPQNPPTTPSPKPSAQQPTPSPTATLAQSVSLFSVPQTRTTRLDARNQGISTDSTPLVIVRGSCSTSSEGLGWGYVEGTQLSAIGRGTGSCTGWYALLAPTDRGGGRIWLPEYNLVPVVPTSTPTPVPSATAIPTTVPTPAPSATTIPTPSPTAAPSATAAPPLPGPSSSFGPGLYNVGSQVQPGTYTNSNTSSYCNVDVNGSRRISNVQGTITLEILASDSIVESYPGCGTWTPS